MKRIRMVGALILLLSLFSQMSGFAQSPAHWDFKTKKINDSVAELILHCRLEGDWHMYSQHTKGTELPIEFKFEKSASYDRIGGVKEPNPIAEYDPYAKDTSRYFKKDVTFRQRIKIKTKQDFQIKGQVSFQLCEKGSCIPPDDVEYVFNVKGNPNFATPVVVIEEEMVAAVPTQQGTLMAQYAATPELSDLRYYTHFSIKKYDDVNFDLLAYDAKDPGMDVGEQYSTLFENGLALDPGYYVLTTGTRLSDGSVLARMQFFTIEPGKTTNIDLVMREPEKGLRIIGNFNSENRYMPLGADEDKSLLQTTGRGFYVLGLLDGGSEPTTHAMQDIALVKDQLDKWGRGFVFLFQNEEHRKNFEKKNFKGLLLQKSLLSRIKQRH